MMRERFHLEISECDIFSALNNSDHERLTSLLRPRSFHENEIIFLKGDPGFGLYLIRSGKVKICTIDRRGVELIFTFLSRGDMLGEMAILDGKPRSATAIAVEDTDTLYLDRGECLEFLKTSPQACIGIIEMLCQRLRRVSSQLEELSFLDVSGRLARSLMEMTKSGSPNVLKREQSFTCTISQEELAKVIGASRVMVNKVLNSFVDLGFVSIGRKRLTILNMHELNRISCYDVDN
jgi:CRP/FNR family cyclic AMP-dependent transcriptional regulator